MFTRRRFGGAIVAIAAGPLLAVSRIPVAIQLFSLRRQCEQDLEGTLAYVRELGFDAVELAGFYGRTANQFKALLDNNSLRCCGSHTPLSELMGSRFDTTVAYNAALQNRNLIIPSLPKQYEAGAAGWNAAATVLNEIASKLSPHRMRVGYHNHDVEFHDIDGLLPWRVLYEQTRPEVILQLDTGNARVAGADPTSLIRQYPGRALTVHVKDYLPGHLDPVIGASNFDWALFERTCATQGGTEWFIIEHDCSRREEAKTCLDAFERLRSGRDELKRQKYF
jgi:sugar phosphate isomerase/epimerase